MSERDEAETFGGFLPGAKSWIARRWLEAVAYLPHAAVVMTACLATYAVKQAGLLRGDAPLMHAALLAGLVLALVPVRARDVAPPLLIVHRTILALFTVFALVSYPVFTDAYLQDAYSEWILVYGRWIAVTAGVLGWFRPGFGLVPVALAAWRKEHMETLFGFSLNATDYYIVAELMVFVCLVIGLVVAVERAAAQLGRPPIPARAAWSLGEAAFLAAFALHLANYFYSAIAKMVLPGAGPLTWILENETHNIMMATAVIGLGPLQGYPALASLGHQVMAAAWLLTNAVTFAVQLGAVLGLLRIRWGIAMTVIYDVMHLGIFLTTGILFWKWMTLNAGLVLALGRFRNWRAPPWPLIMMGLGVLLLSPILFRIASLGWFDSAALDKPVIEAVLEGGSTVRVPTNHFLEVATQMAKSEVGAPFPGHLGNFGAFGKANLGAEQMRRAATCNLPVEETSRLSEAFEADPRLERFFVEHHAWMLDHAGADGRFPYNWFPHHNWANPRLFREFAGTDLRDITAYRYIIESVCLSYDGEGGVDEKLLLRGAHDIPVR